MSSYWYVAFLCYVAVIDGIPSKSRPSMHPLAHSLWPGSDTNLSLVSTPISTEDLYKDSDLKTGSGTKLDEKEVGKIGSQGKFQRLNAQRAKQQALTFAAQARVMDMRQRLTYFRMTSWSKYSAASSGPGFQNAIFLSATTPYGSGTDSCMSVKDGDKSHSHHHSVSTCNFSVHMEHL
jgi:hypothetical protein